MAEHINQGINGLEVASNGGINDSVNKGSLSDGAKSNQTLHAPTSPVSIDCLNTLAQVGELLERLQPQDSVAISGFVFQMSSVFSSCLEIATKLGSIHTTLQTHLEEIDRDNSDNSTAIIGVARQDRHHRQVTVQYLKEFLDWLKSCLNAQAGFQKFCGTQSKGQLLSASFGAHESLRNFTCFCSLPTDVRVQIWQLAMSTEEILMVGVDVSFSYGTCTFDGISLRSTTKKANLLQACHISRELAAKALTRLVHTPQFHANLPTDIFWFRTFNDTVADILFHGYDHKSYQWQRVSFDSEFWFESDVEYFCEKFSLIADQMIKEIIFLYLSDDDQIDHENPKLLNLGSISSTSPWKYFCEDFFWEGQADIDISHCGWDEVATGLQQALRNYNQKHDHANQWVIPTITFSTYRPKCN